MRHMQQVDIDLMILTETQVAKTGMYESNMFLFIFSGRMKTVVKINDGVAVLIAPQFCKFVADAKTHSARIITVTIAYIGGFIGCRVLCATQWFGF